MACVLSVVDRLLLLCCALFVVRYVSFLGCCMLCVMFNDCCVLMCIVSFVVSYSFVCYVFASCVVCVVCGIAFGLVDLGL